MQEHMQETQTLFARVRADNYCDTVDERILAWPGYESECGHHGDAPIMVEVNVPAESVERILRQANDAGDGYIRYHILEAADPTLNDRVPDVADRLKGWSYIECLSCNASTWDENGFDYYLPGLTSYGPDGEDLPDKVAKEGMLCVHCGKSIAGQPVKVAQ